jgi:Zn-dependent protease with chaperone function
MTTAMAGFELFLLAGVVFLAVGSLLSAIVVSFVRSRLTTWPPHVRHRLIVGLAALPALTALALLLSASLPAIIALVLPGFDHCRLDDHGHAHLCFVHPPTVGVDGGILVLLTGLLGYVLLRTVLAASGLVRALRLVVALDKTGERPADLGITIVETNQPVCFTAGLLRPRVFVSRNLFDSLSPEERAVVVHHERAHIHRRDALVGTVVRALAMMHLPSIGRWIVQELEVAAEQACDEEAARLVADRVAVAVVILAMERALAHAASREVGPVAVAFGSRAVERRVEALLRDAPPAQSLGGPLLAAAVGLVALLGSADELHHVTETVLSIIAH